VYPVFGIPGNSFSDTSMALSGSPVNPTTASAVGTYSLPSSTHSGGVMAVFCDGHVQFVKDGIASYTYAQLVTSDSKWRDTPQPSGTYYTNSARANAWLDTFRATTPPGTPPYILSEDDFK
jgi:prepilin-type processing-associated H-X9-DG protein